MEKILTNRLMINQLTVSDAPDICRLVNTPGWLQFIGDRNVHTTEAAEVYLQNGIFKNYRELGYGFFAIRDIKSSDILGICGFTHRDYLPNPDFGFAFFPEHHGKGIAYESSIACLNYGKHTLGFKQLSAFTTMDNLSSIRLLEKLGFQFERLIQVPNELEPLKLFQLNLDTFKLF